MRSSKIISFAIVILTPDDIGYPKEDDAKEDAKRNKESRARQNVYLELGFFVGKLGRERVAALYKKPVVIPSDYAGVQYISLDDLDWQLKLAQELKHAGIPFDFNLALE